MQRISTQDAPLPPLDNESVARRLDELAELLNSRDANPFRVRAYHAAAGTLRALDRPVGEVIACEGVDGLTQLPGIGQSLARSIETLTRTGELPLLRRLRGSGKEPLLTTVAGIWEKTAARIHQQLRIESLEDLECAAYDGRLACLRGMGPKRIRAVRESLAGRFGRRPFPPRPIAPPAADAPAVADLLSIDEEFRRKAHARRLLQVAPRRFNPAGNAWLPILHTHRGDSKYTALFSNTIRAHEFGGIGDWVVIYCQRRHGGGQWTVVTSRLGRLKGRRLVRGREAECETHYAAAADNHLRSGELF